MNPSCGILWEDANYFYGSGEEGRCGPCFSWCRTHQDGSERLCDGASDDAHRCTKDPTRQCQNKACCDWQATIGYDPHIAIHLHTKSLF